MMDSLKARDLLTSFSPSMDYLAISSGDGRIKIWDTLKGQIQTDVADILSNEEESLYAKRERGHLSVDYTCMKWLSVTKKKKRKLGSSLLALGTGSGDVLAIDVSAGSLKWAASDCHPGGVTAISVCADGSYIYTAGVDGMVCKLDSMTGNLLEKFKASSKAISSISVSPDGKVLSTAAAQLKVFDCSDHKKIQNFSGHPVAVRHMIFTQDRKYILSSAVGEKNIAIWGIDGTKKKSASCVLAMEHPAVFIDSKFLEKGEDNERGLYVLAISEMGVCYLWYGKDIEDLRNSKPAKVSSFLEDSTIDHKSSSLPAIFAAKLQDIAKPSYANVFVTYGLLVKPLFQKILVKSGKDIKLVCSRDGILLPKSQLRKAKKGLDTQIGVTTLDRTNAEEVILPLPKIFHFPEKLQGDKKGTAVKSKDDDDDDKVDVHAVMSGMEAKLKSLGVLRNHDRLLSDVERKGIDLKSNTPQKKIRAAVLSMAPKEAYTLLKALVALWHSRSYSAHHTLPWISFILIHNSRYIFQQPKDQVLQSLYEICKSRGDAVESLLQLSGRLQLITAQIDKAIDNKNQIFSQDDQMDESEDDEDVDEHLYNEEDDESQISSDDDE